MPIAASKCVSPLPGCEPEIGRWLWALEEVRRRTLELVANLEQQLLDWEGPDGQENAIGSLLCHVALVEASWLFMDLLQQEIPAAIRGHFPHDDLQTGFARVLGIPLPEHLARLTLVRQALLEAISPMALSEWRRPREPVDRPGYEVTPEWAIFHLIEHEAGHAAQISSLRARAVRRHETARSS